jgi:Zn-dependent peptidase ImmA (M78 family)
VRTWVESRFDLPAPDLLDLRDEQPEVAALVLRQHWGLGERPIKNMVHLLEAKGIRVYSLAENSVEVDAFALWHSKTPFVFLNTLKSAEHGRFDAAHELGHLVLHRHSGPQIPDAEKQANAFASAFLTPRASVLARAPRMATLRNLIQLKKQWIVSVAALTYRLHALDTQQVSIGNAAIALHSGEDVPLRSMGLGSSRLLVAGLQRRAASDAHIALIDEIEHGLEPYRIARLLNVLGSKESAPIQIFLTTHSPVVLRELSSTQIIVLRSPTNPAQVHRAIEVADRNDRSVSQYVGEAIASIYFFGRSPQHLAFLLVQKEPIEAPRIETVPDVGLCDCQP